MALPGGPVSRFFESFLLTAADKVAIRVVPTSGGSGEPGSVEEERVSKDLSAGQLAVSVKPGKPFKIDAIYFNLSEAMTDEVYVEFKDSDATTYLVKLMEWDGDTSYAWAPEGFMNFGADDEVIVRNKGDHATGTLICNVKYVLL